MKRVRLVISGRVQGVFFRASTRDEAHRLGLRGWVRNLETGDVEAVAEGDPHAVERFIDWCRQGPRLASVSRVDISEEPSGERLNSFTIRYY